MNRDRTRRSGFTLTELLVVLGLTALITGTVGHLLRSGVLVNERGTEAARTASRYADVLAAIGDELRAARSASEWSGDGVQLAFADRDVRYAAAKGGVYRAVRPAGGSWAVDPPEGLLAWDEGSLSFSVGTDGLVVIDLAGDGVAFRTAVLPRGVFAAVLSGGGGGGNNGRGNDGDDGRGNDGDDGRGNDGNNGWGRGEGGGRDHR